MRSSVRQFVRNCDICGRTSVWREAKERFLKSLPVSERLGNDLTIDFVTDLPESNGCSNVMVITDRLGKDVFLFATKTMNAELCAQIFIDRYFRYFGFPRHLTSDRGSDCLSHFWQLFCKSIGISQRLTTAYHPQSNASERANQELFKYLCTFTCYAQNDWADLLPMAQLALNLRSSSVIGRISPFFSRHGYDINPIQEPVTDNGRRHPGEISAEKLVNRMKEARDFAQAATATAQQRYEENANRFRKQPETFKVGDKVWLSLQNINTPQLSKKLSWLHAKYEVTAVPVPLTVELNVPGKIRKRFHVELFKRAGNDPQPSQKCDDTQNPVLSDEFDEPEYEVTKILRARTIKRGRGQFRQALVKYSTWADPSWEPIDNIKDTVALDDFERDYGPIETNDGPPIDESGAFVGPAEEHVKSKRRQRKQKRVTNQKAKREGL
ncbi:hypothetical protein K3495_g3151 [Podosphaera aphanis]|nr:hypothetical protein K3495_g3151 [Podosphaera aphanis]